MVGGGRHLVLRGNGKRAALGSSIVGPGGDGGHCTDPGERTLGSDSPAGQPVQPHHDTMAAQTELQLTSPILTGSSRPLSTYTWHLYITTPHLDRVRAGLGASSGPTHTRSLSQPGVPWETRVLVPALPLGKPLPSLATSSVSTTATTAALYCNLKLAMQVGD